jgi:negative regulator of flagellin synthesis FlgM
MSIDQLNSSNNHLGLAKTNKGSTAPTDQGEGRKLGTTGPDAQPGQKVSISDRANRLAQLEAEVRSTPDVEPARVKEIREAISDGSYQINAEAIADRLLSIDKSFT